MRRHQSEPHALSTRPPPPTTYETIANALADKQVYVVQRDVTKAFDKIWHDGLKYILLRLRLPTILGKNNI